MKACLQIASATYFLRKDIKIPISANYSRIICANGVKKYVSADYLRVLVFLFNTEPSARRDKQGL